MSDPTDEPGSALWTAVLDARAALEHALSAGDPQAATNAQLAYEVAYARWEADTAARVDAAVGPAYRANVAAAPTHLTGKIWTVAQASGTAGEAGELGISRPFVGVCLSGGGSRSMSASMGALRGLRAMGLLDRVSFLSCVSGGAWAGVTYTYLPDAIDDDTFLGPVVTDPSQLTWSGSGPTSLQYLPQHAMGYAATQIGISAAAEIAAERWYDGDPKQLLWQRAVGELILSNFGLGDGTSQGSPARYYSHTPGWLKRILEENPKLSAKDFALVREGRPYLIVNSTLFYPPPVGSGSPNPRAPLTELYPFELTPITSGVVPPFPGAGEGGADLGGGYVDPFTFGSQAPGAPVGATRTYRVPTPAYRFALSDMAGTSSAAFEQAVIDYMPVLDGMDPYYPYWPVLNAGAAKNPANDYYLGDGGILENLGIVSLLRRGIPNILSFVNTDMPLVRQTGTGPIVEWNEIQVSSDIPPLFGYQPWSWSNNGYQPIPQDSPEPYANNQVFDPDDFPALVVGLWGASQAGGSAIMKQSLTTVANPRFGVAAGVQVNVLWIYNNPVQYFNDQLDSSIKEWWHWNYDLLGFPVYNTFTQLTLSVPQVTLLAHLSCWNVMNETPIGDYPSNASLVRSMFQS